MLNNNRASSASASGNSAEQDGTSARWFDDVSSWASRRIQEQDLSRAIHSDYLHSRITRVIQLRSFMMTDAEFVKMCQTTSQALLYRTYLFIVGVERRAELERILAAMISALSEYPAYYNAEDVVSGRISPHDFAKIQLFESELYAYVQALFTHDTEWFARQEPEFKAAATRFWTSL